MWKIKSAQACVASAPGRPWRVRPAMAGAMAAAAMVNAARSGVAKRGVAALGCALWASAAAQPLDQPPVQPSLQAHPLSAIRAPWAAEPALGLATAQALALQRSQAVPAQQAAAQAARSRALAAQRRPDPVLRLGLDNVPVEGGSDSLLTREPTTARSIGLAQALPSAAKRAARGAVFQRDAEVAQAEAEREAKAVLLATGLAWLNLRAEQQRLRALDAQRLQAARLHQAAEAAYRAAQGAQADVFAARAAQARLDDTRLQTQLMHDQALISLQRWTGEAAGRTRAEPTGAAAAAETGLDPAGPGPATDTETPMGADVLDTLQEGAWADRPAAELVQGDPELWLADALEAVADAAVTAASQDRQADWSVDLRFQQRGPRFDNMVSMGLSIPLRWGTDTVQERELTARLALQQAAAAQAEETRRARVAEVRRWQQGWRQGQARLRWHDEQRLPLARAEVQAALAAYRAGRGSLQAVLAAQQVELGLALERIALELVTAGDALRLQTLARPAVVNPPTAFDMQEQPR